jgi:hypothetical protein
MGMDADYGGCDRIRDALLNEKLNGTQLKCREFRIQADKTIFQIYCILHPV